jgi:hypothetical protein
MKRQRASGDTPDEPRSDLAGSLGPVLELPSEATCETKDRLAQALVRILVRQIRAELCQNIQQ